jgi:hypothetical protein
MSAVVVLHSLPRSVIFARVKFQIGSVFVLLIPSIAEMDYTLLPRFLVSHVCGVLLGERTAFELHYGLAHRVITYT